MSPTAPRAAPRTPAAKKAAVSKPSGNILTNEHVFLTGATGFVGQAVLERLLADYPKTRISVLIRAKGSAPVEQRLTQLMRKPVFKNWIDRVGEDEAMKQVAKRVKVINGSLANVGTLPGDIDVVIHGASTVSFDPPIDEAFDTNVGGAFSVYGALLDSGSNPHVVHVSKERVVLVLTGEANKHWQVPSSSPPLCANTMQMGQDPLPAWPPVRSQGTTEN